MNAFSTVGGVFTDPGFAAPGNALRWSIGGLDETRNDGAGFLIMPKRPYEWRVDAHGCYKFDNAALGFAPRCLPSPPRHQPSWPRQHHVQCSSPATSCGTCCWKERPHAPPQAACTAIHPESSGNAVPVQFRPERHTNPTTAFSQYRPNTKTSCFIHRSPHWLDA